jgi:hypothetical protein
MKKTLFTAILLLFVYTVNSQVLISLLLGDKLNSPNLEFGLDGGANFLNMSNTPNSKNLTSWNLGFYFDFKLQPKLFIHTGVLVKTIMGCSGLTPYSLPTSSLDSAFKGGTVDREIHYFNVPVLLRYQFFKTFHIEGGFQAGLRYKSYDLFKQTVENEDDLNYKHYIKDDIARLDFGPMAGIGYKFDKGPGMTLDARFYYGVVDVNKVDAGTQNVSAIYLNASFPIGKKKAAEKAAEKKEAEEKAAGSKN